MNAKMKPKGSTPQLQQGSCPSRAFERSSPRRAGIAADDQRFLGERIVVTVFVIEHPRTRCAPTPRPGRRRTHRELPFPCGPCRWQSPLPGAPIFVQKRELAHARATADYTHLLHVADFAGARTLIRASLTG